MHACTLLRISHTGIPSKVVRIVVDDFKFTQLCRLPRYGVMGCHSHVFHAVEGG